jgi:hypothetical protein
MLYFIANFLKPKINKEEKNVLQEILTLSAPWYLPK